MGMVKKSEYSLELEEKSIQMSIEEQPAEEKAGIWIKELESNKSISFEIDKTEAQDIVDALTEIFKLKE